MISVSDCSLRYSVLRLGAVCVRSLRFKFTPPSHRQHDGFSILKLKHYRRKLRSNRDFRFHLKWAFERAVIE